MANKPVIVIDPGHGGKEKVGGSSPNNATGANGLLEKNLTLDVANRVAAMLAAQANVFLTRASDTNLGLSDRAKFARDKNAQVFLSLHFNGFHDTSIDGTEVWVAKKANQGSRDFAKTLLGKVVNATNLKDRGVREGDLGVILPTRHAANTSACLLEISFLTNPAQARELEKDDYRQNIADSICYGVRQFLSLPPTAQSFFYVSDDFVSSTAAGGNGAPKFASARDNTIRRNQFDASAVELRMDDPRVAKEKKSNLQAFRCEANRQLKAQWEKVKEEMVRIATEEFQVIWDNGNKRETEAAMKQVIRTYWQDAVFPGETIPGSLAIPAESWSAAFIAWVVKEAGGGDRFSKVHDEAKFRQNFRPRAHWRYVAPALINKTKLSQLNPFWAYAIDAVTPKVGDIVVKSRDGSGLTLNQLSNLTGNASDGQVGWFSHGDIVVRVDRDRNEIRVIGGNLGGTVQETIVSLDANGFVQSTGGTHNDHLAIVRINTDQYDLPECV